MARSKGGRAAARVLLWALPVLCALAAWIAVRRARDEAELFAAINRLGDGDLVAARAVFIRQRDSAWTGERARAGLAIVRALAGDIAAPGDETPRDLEPFDVRRLLEDTLARRAFASCVRLARLAQHAGEPIAPAYLAAGLVELGAEGDAIAALAAAEGNGSRGLGAEVARVLEILSTPPPYPSPQGIRLALAPSHENKRARDEYPATYGGREVPRSRLQSPGTLVRDRGAELAGVLGDSGALHLLDDALSPWVPAESAQELAGHVSERGLRLSVDFGLSRLAETALGEHRGTIVLLDPQSGAILAAVSDARTMKEGGTPAFAQRREPASIAKLITTSAALRAGLDPDAEISRMICTGSQQYEGGILWCSRPAGALAGLDDAMAKSCNTAFANLAIRIGRQAVVDEFRRYGFDSDLLGAGRITTPEGNERQLADLSIGLEATDITPLHAALLAAVIANDGMLPVPMLVTASDGLLGRSPRPLPLAAPRTVLDPRGKNVLRKAMQAVMLPGGTGAGLAPDGFPVAMKTGTASEWRHGYHVNYIGFGPLPDARVAFCVRVTHQPSSWRASLAGREVTAFLLDGLAARLHEMSRGYGLASRP